MFLGPGNPIKLVLKRYLYGMLRNLHNHLYFYSYLSADIHMSNTLNIDSHPWIPPNHNKNISLVCLRMSYNWIKMLTRNKLRKTVQIHRNFRYSANCELWPKRSLASNFAAIFSSNCPKTTMSLSKHRFLVPGNPINLVSKRYLLWNVE